MKLKLNKKKLKNLSKDSNILPADMTPQIGGGGHTLWCPPMPKNTAMCSGDGNYTPPGDWNEPPLTVVGNCSPSDFGSCGVNC
ncbi:MAG: hypothetical protein HRT53_03225 [Colwellia sp.]|nr:hypothetical protein [Colwellia sp.]